MNIFTTTRFTNYLREKTSACASLFLVLRIRRGTFPCSLSMEMSRLTRDGTAEPISQDQILRRERAQGTFHFPCLADHGQDWQPYPIDPYSCYMCDHTYILSHTVVGTLIQPNQTPTTHDTNTRFKLTIVTILSFSERLAIANLSCHIN